MMQDGDQHSRLANSCKEKLTCVTDKFAQNWKCKGISTYFARTEITRMGKISGSDENVKYGKTHIPGK